jgi:hypothetical protein
MGPQMAAQARMIILTNTKAVVRMVRRRGRRFPQSTSIWMTSALVVGALLLLDLEVGGGSWFGLGMTRAWHWYALCTWVRLPHFTLDGILPFVGDGC